MTEKKFDWKINLLSRATNLMSITDQMNQMSNVADVVDITNVGENIYIAHVGDEHFKSSRQLNNWLIKAPMEPINQSNHPRARALTFIYLNLKDANPECGSDWTTNSISVGVYPDKVPLGP